MIFNAHVDAWPPSGDMVRWHDVGTTRFWFDVTLTYGGADDESGGGGRGNRRKRFAFLVVIVVCFCVLFAALAGAACVIRRLSRKRLHEIAGVEMADVSRVEVAEAVVIDAKDGSPRSTAQSRSVSFVDSTDSSPSFPAVATPPANGLAERATPISLDRATPADVA